MWKLLKVGDVVEATDDVFQNQLGWHNVGVFSPHAVGVTVSDKIALSTPVRRKISDTAEAEKPTANTGSPKLPTLEECENAVVNSDNDHIQILRDCAIVRRCYDFICRQLQADA